MWDALGSDKPLQVDPHSAKSWGWRIGSGRTSNVTAGAAGNAVPMGGHGISTKGRLLHYFELPLFALFFTLGITHFPMS